MKLYTEEQVRKAILIGSIHLKAKTIDELVESLTPIELPSDEEIEYKSAFEYPFNPDIHNEIRGIIISGERGGFENGAKWLKEQILNQNK